MTINKRGEIFNSYILIFVLVGILVVGMILFFVYSLIGPPVTSSVGSLASQIQLAAGQPEVNSIAPVVNGTLGPISQATQTFEWIGYGALVFFFLGFFIMLFYVRTYPFLIFVYIPLILVLVLLSIFVANAYESVAGTVINGQRYDSWGANHYILANLPMIMGAMGLVGGVILFVLATRDSEAGLEI